MTEYEIRKNADEKILVSLDAMVGKTVAMVHPIYPTLGIVFDDGTFIGIDDDSDVLDVDDFTDEELRDMGMISEEDYKESADKACERTERELYERLKAKYGGEG